jgi:uncharacterized protein YkwD
LRKLAAAVLAVPVVIVLYLPVVLRRSIAARLVLGIGVGGLLALGAIGISRPAETVARPPVADVPLTRAEFTTDLRVGQAPDAAVQIAFSTPMQARSVDAALRVEPATAVELTWNADSTVLSVAPRGTWRTATYHTITVEPGALAATGRPLTVPARAAFLTRPAAGATIRPTSLAGERVRLDSAFVVEFDRAVDATTLGEVLKIEPAVAGSWQQAGRRDGGNRYVFTPRAPLAPDTEYRVALVASILDADGASVDAPDPLVVRTAAIPGVVRFRPVTKSTDVERGANVSVRFTQAMDQASTKRAFSVTVDGKAVEGKSWFAEGGTVLVFDPAADFGYSAAVSVTVAAGATSADGVPLAKAVTGTFTTEAKPAPKPKPKAPPSTTTSVPKPPSAGSGSWTAVEAYYLRLMNCTRTGGWVTSTGACSSPGGRDVAPLLLDSGISSRVARPYAKLLATRGLCTHFADGGPDDRLRRAGYTSYQWAENIGCRSGNPSSAVLGSHLYFQSEKSYNGGHYVNMMSTKYDRVGIGVWVYGGRVRLVVDFYRPR